MNRECQRLVLMARAPAPGEVKTRLARHLGPDGACAVYRQLLRRVVGSLQPFRAEARVTPDHRLAASRSLFPNHWTVVAQGEGDLGARMERAVIAHAASGASAVVIVGADCPGLSGGDVTRAFERLREADLVLGPAEDGGYWLLGLRRPMPELFRGMPWGGPAVREETLRRAGEAGARVELLGLRYDVDTLEDWKRFQAESGAG